MDPDGKWTSTRATLLAAAGQNCWPPAGSYMAATGQDLMAADNTLQTVKRKKPKKFIPKPTGARLHDPWQRRQGEVRGDHEQPASSYCSASTLREAWTAEGGDGWNVQREGPPLGRG